MSFLSSRMSNVRSSASKNAERRSDEIVKVRLYSAGLNC